MRSRTTLEPLAAASAQVLSALEGLIRAESSRASLRILSTEGLGAHLLCREYPKPKGRVTSGKSLGSGLAVRGYPVAGGVAIPAVEVDGVEPDEDRNGNEEHKHVAHHACRERQEHEAERERAAEAVAACARGAR